jgi:CRP/FNR family transcriptional regulator
MKSAKAAGVPACAAGEPFVLAAGEIIFREGEPRAQAYRIETGAVCLFKTRADGALEVLKFAFPGDIVGLGYLDSHTTSAQAAMDTSLCRLPRTAFDAGAETSALAVLRQEAFDPALRVAALFVTLSRYNAYEGRDPAILTDSLKCGTVAGHLGISVAQLAEQLAELEARGLIEPCDSGLRLLDLEELERLADSRN